MICSRGPRFSAYAESTSASAPSGSLSAISASLRTVFSCQFDNPCDVGILRLKIIKCENWKSGDLISKIFNIEILNRKIFIDRLL